VSFGALYILNISIQSTFSRPPYSFGTLILGLSYIPNSLGYILTAVLGGRWVDKIMHREARAAGRYTPDGKLDFRPEDRMRENIWLSIIIYPGALLWYGWTAEKGIIWIVPLIANFFFGAGSMLLFATATTMLTEFMPRKSSNGIAVQNFVRNIASCVGGRQHVITGQIFNHTEKE
jgi:MFS family permease